MIRASASAIKNLSKGLNLREVFLSVIHHLRDVSPGSGLAAHVGLQDALAHPQAERRDLQQFVVGDVLDAVVQAHRARRGEPHGNVFDGRADIGEMLLFADVDGHVLAPRVLAHDHALVHMHAGADE